MNDWCRILVVIASFTTGAAYFFGKRAGLKEAQRILNMMRR